MAEIEYRAKSAEGKGKAPDVQGREGVMIPRYTGVDAEGIAETEADHFRNCPVCGALVDMRDLGQLLEHRHDAGDQSACGTGV
jgi:hypothetical protein